jgi:hypothetical protein
MADTMRRRRRAAIETGSPVPGWPPSLAPSLEQLAKCKNSRELAHKSDPIGHLKLFGIRKKLAPAFHRFLKEALLEAARSTQ